MALVIRNHGTVRGYKAGCRCEQCTEANRAARQKERDRRRAKSGRTAPRSDVPQGGQVVPTRRRPEVTGDEIQQVIERAAFEARGLAAGAALAADRLRDAGYRLVVDGPIEAAARRALASVGGDSALAVLRRETAFRAAAAMDDPKVTPFLKSVTEVLRVTVADLLADAPEKGGETDALNELMGTFGSRGSARGSAPMGDAAASE